MSLSPERRTRVLAAARSIPSRTRAESQKRTLLFGTCALLAVALVWFGAPPLMHAKSGLAHAAGRPVMLGIANVVGCLAIAAIATWAALTRGRSMVGHPLFMWSVTMMTPLLFGIWTMLFHTAYEDPSKHVLGWRCFVLTLVTAPWPFAVMTALARRIEPRSPNLVGAAFGSAAAAWAGAMVVLWCPLAEPGHVVRGHVLPFVVLAVCGALIGRRLFAVR